MRALCPFWQTFNYSLTYKCILWTASAWELVAPIIWNRLNSLSRFHDERAGDVGTSALVHHATVVNPVLDQDGVLWAAVGLGRAGTHHSIALNNDGRGRIGHQLVTNIGEVI